MADETKRCAAITKSGTPCKNKAQAGSAYCYVHRNVAAQTQTAPKPPAAPAQQTQFQELGAELNELVNEIRAQFPEYAPPPFSPQALVAMLRENLHRFTPEMQLDIVNQLKANFEGTTPQDLIDPETWKGLWYVLNYSLQMQSNTLKEQLAHRLSALPGVALLSDLKSNLAGTSAKDLLDVDTWKGAWYILNHSLKVQADEMKRKLLGQGEEV